VKKEKVSKSERRKLNSKFSKFIGISCRIVKVEIKELIGSAERERVRVIDEGKETNF
jgi:hypothetical protein